MALLRRDTHDTLLLAAMAAAALAVEALLMASLMRETLSIGEYFAGHAVVCAVLFLWAAAVRRRHGDWRFPAIMAMTICVMGVVGAAGSFLGLVLHAWYRRNALPFAQWYASLFPRSDDSAMEELRQNLRGADEATSIAPFIDILREGGTNRRLVVVALMGRHFRLEFAPALKLALQDRNSAVRVQAGNAIAQIENRFFRQADRLAAAVRNNPDDAALMLDLARHYEEYADTGILDDERRQENYEIALETYLQAAEINPGDGPVKAAIGRLLLKERRYAEAEPWLKEATKTASDDTRATLLYMEALFHMGRWRDLRELSREHADIVSGDPDLPPEAAEAVALWANLEPAVASGGVRP